KYHSVHQFAASSPSCASVIAKKANLSCFAAPTNRQSARRNNEWLLIKRAARQLACGADDGAQMQYTPALICPCSGAAPQGFSRLKSKVFR
ncbi:hypothetical protein, partial [Klebsiella aerogenes]|uniref:hypothetical protein n=1 Tax=Klebsiella aerogenes TaxID=548 RepID=UPI001BCB0988